MINRRTKHALGVALLLLVGCQSKDPVPLKPSPKVQGQHVLHVGATTDLLAGMKLAAAETGLEVKQVRRNFSRGIAAATSENQVLGAVVEKETDITGAADALQSSNFPVFAIDDYYDQRKLQGGLYQLSAPHSWQSFRIARYLGPGDRKFRKVGLLRPQGEPWEAFAEELAAALRLRGLTFIQGSLEQLIAERPDAVVIDGPSAFIDDALDDELGKLLAISSWRPQVVGFESMFQAKVSEGIVIAGDYARAEARGPVPAAVSNFMKAFESRFKRVPTSDEMAGYDAVKIIADPTWRETRILDRARFAHLPITLGPADSVVAERDVLGLWAYEGGEFKQIMRSFTSDLSRTNILEEDWPVYFDNTVPGGEAPFFYNAKSGITRRSD